MIKLNFKKYAKKYLGPASRAQIAVNYRRIKKGLPPRIVNFRTPTRFTDKILWLKKMKKIQHANILADKIAVRNFVEDKIGSDILIPICGVYENPNDIDFNNIPEHFVMKPNHTSGHFFFGQRENVDKEKLLNLANKWLQIDYYIESAEYQYLGIPRKVFFEGDMRPLGSSSLNDFKFFCFNGEPLFVQVDEDRFSNHSRGYYDNNWKRLNFDMLYPKSINTHKKPKNFKKMLEIASTLSVNLCFVRVDLYNIDGTIYFSEITFHPDGGHGPILPESFDFYYGSKIDLSVT